MVNSRPSKDAFIQHHILCSIAFCLGIGAVLFADAPMPLGIALAGAGTILLALVSSTRRLGGLALLGLLIACVGLGIVRGGGASFEIPEITREKTDLHLEIRVERPGFSDSPWRGRILSAPDHPRLEGARIMVDSPEEPMVASYTVSGVLSPAPARRNPGGFAYGEYLERHGITGILEVEDMIPRGSPGMSARIGQRLEQGLLDSGLPAGARALTRALCLGDRRGLTDHDSDLLRRAGVAHLLAVSGMHIAVLGAIVLKLLTPLIGRRTSALVAMGLVFSYALLVGATSSSLRAALVFGVHGIARAFDRSSPPGTSLALAAAILLAHDPYRLVEVGFQLSFAASAAILIVFHTWACRGPGKVMGLLACSSGAWVATMPLALWHFARLAPLGLALSPILTPIFPIILMAAWCTGLLSLVGAPAIMVGAVATPLQLVYALMTRCGEMAPVLDQNVGLLATGFLGGTAVVLLTGNDPRRRFTLASLGRWILVAGLWVSALMFVWAPEIPAPGDLRMIMFDVGQGDAILVEVGSEEALLVDAGPAWEDYAAITHSVIPYLKDRGHHTIDRVLITHGHLDHYGGLDALSEKITVDEIWYSTPGSFRPPEEVKAKEIHRGESWMAESARFSVKWPANDAPAHWGLNERSAVLSVEYGAWRALLTGDLEGVGEAALLRLGAEEELAADFLKVGHHGSDSASSSAFLARVSPELAGISVGHNFYGHPHPDTLERLLEVASRVVTTEESGALVIETDGERWRAVTMRPASSVLGWDEQ